MYGLSSGYSITQEGNGYRITDTFMGDGDDGSDFLSGIETVTFVNGVTVTLGGVNAPLETSGKEDFGSATVLPGLDDDDFLVVTGDLVGPQDFLNDFQDNGFTFTGGQVLLVDGNMPELLPLDGMHNHHERHAGRRR
jgi:hypothetical protein